MSAVEFKIIRESSVQPPLIASQDVFVAPKPIQGGAIAQRVQPDLHIDTRDAAQLAALGRHQQENPNPVPNIPPLQVASGWKDGQFNGD